MGTKKNARTGKGKLENLEPKVNPQAGATGGAGAGKVQMQDFHFVMKHA